MAIAGFCWGGRIVWLYAAHHAALKAGVAWSGMLSGPKHDLQPAHPLDVAAGLKVPGLGLYGGADQGIPNATVQQMRATLEAAGKPTEIVLYPGTPHAFFADYRPSCRRKQAEDGSKKMLEWFQKHGA